MPIYRFTASLDNTITNALKNGLQTRATGSNQGLADSLQVFSIYGQASGSDANSRTVEKSRILVQFPVGEISAARSAGTIPPEVLTSILECSTLDILLQYLEILL